MRFSFAKIWSIGKIWLMKNSKGNKMLPDAILALIYVIEPFIHTLFWILINFAITFGLVALALLGFLIGWLVRKKPLERGCGRRPSEKTDLDCSSDASCSLCGGDPLSDTKRPNEEREDECEHRVFDSRTGGRVVPHVLRGTYRDHHLQVIKSLIQTHWSRYGLRPTRPAD